MRRLLSKCLPDRLFARRLPRSFDRHVLLTFDDGPHPDTTPAVLALLEEFGARAVFFVVGNRIQRAPHLLARVQQSGHALGNHSYGHPVDRPMGYQDYLRDLQQCQDEIERHCGSRPVLHRPPLGTISVATALAPRRLGLRSVLWSQSSEDWRFQSDAEADSCAARLERDIRPRDIVLMHDEKMYTATLLERLLPALRKRGLHLAPSIARAFNG